MDEQPDFDEFFAASWPRLLRSTFAVTRDLARAEDALQTAFAQAFASWGRVARADDPLAYVRRMAFHSALAQRRLAFRRRETTTAQPPEPSAPDPSGAADERGDLWAAIGQLPPRQRAVVVLRFYEDLTERQIADALGIRPGTVKSQASAAMGHLRAQLSAPAPDGGHR